MKYFFILICLFFTKANAQVIDTGDQTKEEIHFPGGELTMNTFSLLEFGDFSENWKMVTVRFREDTSEMRITYANPIAYKHLILTKGKSEYPDGAAFAKIGIKTISDPLFTSSIVPAGSKRFQFMVHDKKKFSATGGWGYALFNSQGRTFPGNMEKNSEACQACHNAAESRGYVFSEPASFNTKLEVEAAPNKDQEAKSTILFVRHKTEKLPELIKKYLGKKIKMIELYSGAMTSKYFSGTLDELIPLLIQRSLVKKQPALFLSEDKKEFSLVQTSLDGKKCSNIDQPVNVIIHQTMGVPLTKNSSKIIYKIIRKESCQKALR